MTTATPELLRRTTVAAAAKLSPAIALRATYLLKRIPQNPVELPRPQLPGCLAPHRNPTRNSRRRLPPPRAIAGDLSDPTTTSSRLQVSSHAALACLLAKLDYLLARGEILVPPRILVYRLHFCRGQLVNAEGISVKGQKYRGTYSQIKISNSVCSWLILVKCIENCRKF
jgi:hypothetical protein